MAVVEGGVMEEREGRRRLAEVLSQLPAWNADQLLQLHRLVRDAAPEVWNAAAETLGRRAVRDGGARAEVVELLDSPNWELRLRGLRALRLAGEADAAEVMPFLEQRLEEAAWLGDAAQLDAVVQAMAGHEGEGLAERLLDDPRETVRAALAAHLHGASPELLHRVARDESPRVRVALASAVGSFDPMPDDLLWTLAADADPLVRLTLADELPRDDEASVAFLEILQQDADPLVREAAQFDQNQPRTLPPEPWDAAPMTRLQELEELLDANPDEPLEALRPVLDSLDAVTLERLAEIARDPELAAFCRVLAMLAPLSGMTRVHARERVLEALGILSTQPGSPGVRSFQAFLAACLRAAEVEDVRSLRAWTPGALDELPDGGARVALLRLLDIVNPLSSPTCADLSTAAAALDELRFQVDRDLPEPERTLMRLVAETWSELIEWSIQRMLAGAES